MTLAASLLLLALQATGSPLVQIDSRSQGRTFLVDPDRKEIRAALRDLTAPPPAGAIPVWLPPFPGAQPWGQGAETDRGDVGHAQYTSNAPADIVFAHYEAAARAAGITI